MADEKVPFDRAAHLSVVREKANEARRAQSAAAGPLPEDYKTRWQQLLDGDIGVEDLDMEELTKMRCRDRLGGFTGRPSKVIPRKLEQAMRAELLARGQRDLENALPIAVATLAEIAGKGLGKDRLVAAQLLLERALGKVADKVELTSHSADPWEDVLQGVISEENLQRVKEKIDRASGE